MSEQEPAFYEAYQPPPVTAEVLPARGGPLGKLKTVAVIAIVLGAMGLFSALTATAGLLVGSRLQMALSPANQPGMTPQLRDAQLAMQNDMQALQDRFQPYNLVLVVLHAILAFFLLAGGLQSLRLVPAGRKLFLAACSIAIVFELIRAVVQGILQVQMGSLMAVHMQKMMEAQSNAPPGLGNMMSSFARIGIVIGLAIGLVWVVAKLVYFVISIRILRKPEVEGLFVEAR
jgi:hypothetical protein